VLGCSALNFFKLKAHVAVFLNLEVPSRFVA
jgi:hypothetical protein